MQAIKMHHDIDPRKDLLDRIGNSINDVEIFNRDILVAVYIRPKMTAGKILLTDNTRGEDEFQGKVGLILKMGPTAFRDPKGEWFEGADINVGDWIVFRTSDGFGLYLGGVLCRQMLDDRVKLKIPHPDLPY